MNKGQSSRKQGVVSCNACMMPFLEMFPPFQPLCSCYLNEQPVILHVCQCGGATYSGSPFSHGPGTQTLSEVCFWTFLGTIFPGMWGLLPRYVAKYITFPGMILYVQTSHCLLGMLATCSCIEIISLYRTFWGLSLNIMIQDLLR